MASISSISASANVTSKPHCHKCLYVYAIVPVSKTCILEVAGVDDEDDEVYTIPQGNIAAVVSRTRRADYRGLGRQEAVRFLVTHQRVVESIMREFPALPVKFGTVLPDEKRVRRLLTQGAALFQSTLEKLAGRIQQEVVVLWNVQQILQQIGQEEQIVQLKAALAGRAPEETVNERVLIGRLAQASLEKRRRELQAQLLKPLLSTAVDAALNPLMDDNMVLNVALLLDPHGRTALDQLLPQLDQQFGGQLLFRSVGPLPPYSFATVEVSTPSFEELDAYRQRLCLAETCDPTDIKQAYHRQAAVFHPDHCPPGANPDAEAQMAALTQAYKAVSAYADSALLAGLRRDAINRAPTEGKHVIFSREVVERTLLIAVQQPGLQAVV